MTAIHSEVEFSEWLFKMKNKPYRASVLDINWGAIIHTRWTQLSVSPGFNSPRCNLCGIPFDGIEPYDFLKMPSTSYVFHQNSHCSPRQYASIGGM